MKEKPQDSGSWGKHDADVYSQAKHGPDGSEFLDPDLERFLRDDIVDYADVVDLGGGTGTWSEHISRLQPKSITLVDKNPAMVEKAKDLMRLRSGELPENFRAEVMDVEDLKLEDESADILLSFNVGCNLQNLRAHFKEAHRIARDDSIFVVTAPNSLLVPFRNEARKYNVQNKIDREWEKSPEHNVQTAKNMIMGLRGLLRATFTLDSDSRPVLRTEENGDDLKDGDEILRYIPGPLAVNNNYHTTDDYLDAAMDAGWRIMKKTENIAASKEALKEHNKGKDVTQQLGPEYAEHAPFLMLKLLK